GLARLEFIINNSIEIHPLALVHPEKIQDEKTKKRIEDITCAYDDKKKFFVDTLACGVGTLAAAFWPKPVIVRLSDFKTNEYRNLIGGSYFEAEEENPMLGFRGASRYYSEQYKDAFALECAALKKVREVMGFENVKIMVPFVRTIKEAQQVLEVMKEFGLERGKDKLEIVMMCEIPSNVILIDEFSKLFDGFSIGSNDLTQLTLGVDRDSGQLAHLFDERDPAVKKMLAMAVEGALASKKYIGICGQAPSDLPEIAQFLIEHGISSISLNADSIVPFLKRYKK
ncbi:phosphoenolpyruvate synthase, partial [bacterium]|nr:phosphoenolpyruvate synthase [bacterium]